MTWDEDPTTRADFLKRGGVALGALAAAGLVGGAGRGLAAGTRTSSETLNWLTWADHYFPEQLAQATKAIGITGKPTLFTDDAAAYLKLKTGGNYDIVSSDALWATKFYKDGLVKPFDLSAIGTSKGLYSAAKHVPFWQAGSGYLAYPKGWSLTLLYYNPKFATPKPDSWEALLSKKYRKRIVIENSASALMLYGGVATGAKDPTNMTTGEISDAKEYLKQLKPNVVKLVAQGDEVIRQLADETAWIGIQWFGTDYRVKDAGGPVVLPSIPKEGTTGWVDGDLLTTRGLKKKDAFIKFMNQIQTPAWTAQVFIKNGHPLFDEKTYKLLVNTGHKERADKAFYNQPELAFKARLWGPSTNQQAYTDAFNEVFGA